MDEAEAQRRMQDPDLAQKRKVAVALFETAIHAIAGRHAHARANKGEWLRQSAWCWSRIALQKSRSGFMCFLNVEYAARVLGQRGPLRSTRIGAFADTTSDHNRLDALYYVDLGETSPLRDEVLGLLADRAMPWLDRAHTMLGQRERNHVPFGMMPR